MDEPPPFPLISGLIDDSTRCCGSLSRVARGRSDAGAPPLLAEDEDEEEDAAGAGEDRP